MGVSQNTDCKDVHFSSYSPTGKSDSTPLANLGAVADIGSVDEDVIGFFVAQFGLDQPGSEAKAELFRRGLKLAVAQNRTGAGAVDLDGVLRAARTLAS